VTATLKAPDGTLVLLRDGRWSCPSDAALAEALNALSPTTGVALNPHGARLDWGVRAFGLSLLEADTVPASDAPEPEDDTVY
jgi:hypothetical protein